MKNLMWTSTELTRLRMFYPIMSRDKLIKEFYPRSIYRICAMASQLKIRKRKDWKAIAKEYQPVIFSAHRVPETIGAREG